MIAGKLDRRITIQKPVQTTNSFGDALDRVFYDVHSTWCRVKPGRGGEKVEDDADTGRSLDEFVIRYPPFNLGTDCRLIYNSNYYDVVHVSELGREEGLMIRAESNRNKFDGGVQGNTGLGFLNILKSVNTSIDKTFYDVVYSETSKVFVAVGDGVIAYSNNGIDWSSATLPNPSASFRAVTENNGRFVAIGVSTLPHYSDNGITWTEVSSAPGGLYNGITYGNNKFLAVGSGKVIYSTNNGVTWSEQSISNGNNWQDVIYSSELGFFIAVASSGSQRVMTSPFGDSAWTARTVPSSIWRSICYDSNSAKLVAVGDSGSIMTATSVSNWSAITSVNTNNYTDVIYSEEIEQILICSKTGTNRLVVSTDGVSFTELAGSNYGDNFQALAYSSHLKRLVGATDSSVFYHSKYNSYLEQI